MTLRNSIIFYILKLSINTKDFCTKPPERTKRIFYFKNQSICHWVHPKKKKTKLLMNNSDFTTSLPVSPSDSQSTEETICVLTSNMKPSSFIVAILIVFWIKGKTELLHIKSVYVEKKKGKYSDVFLLFPPPLFFSRSLSQQRKTAVSVSNSTVSGTKPTSEPDLHS